MPETGGGAQVQVTDGYTPPGSPFSLSAVGVLFTVDTTGYESIAVHTTALTTATVTYEVSNDGVNWVTVVGYAPSNTGNAAPATLDTAVNLRVFPCVAKWFRQRVSAWTAGVVTAIPYLRDTPFTSLGVFIGNTTLPAQALTTTAATGGLTIHHRKATADTNLVNVKATAARLYKAYAYNASAAVKYLKLYNKASAPVVASDVPVLVFPLAIGANPLDFGDIGFSFSAGLSFAITGALADTDATALVANDVILNLGYV